MATATQDSTGPTPARWLQILRLTQEFGPVIAWTIARRHIWGPKAEAWNLQTELFAELLRYGARENQRVKPSLTNLRKLLPKRTPFLRECSLEQVVIEDISSEWLVHPLAQGSPRVVLYLHGGGYCTLSAATHRGLTSRISKSTSSRVLAINYRLAPEHPFPAGLEDSLKVYQWLIRPDGGNVDPGNVAIMGDSAGGGLTMATILYLRDHDLPLPAFVVGISPWIDLRCSTKSWLENKYDYLTRPQEDVNMPLYYAGSEANLQNPLVSPIFANLAGLPPMLIQCGELEVLYDEDIAFAQKAKKSGVDVKLEVYPDMLHAFPAVGKFLFKNETQQALASIGDFASVHFKTPGPRPPLSIPRFQEKARL